MVGEDGINRIDIKEFREFGYLQELNRRFLHPLGLAMEIIILEDGTETLGGVWDYRDDTDGMAFGEVDQEKALRISDEWVSRGPAREVGLGYVVQPVDLPQVEIHE